MNSPENIYNITIADDHAILRDGLVNLINEDESLNVVGEAKNGLELLELLETVSCDLIILDLSMPKMHGLDAIDKIKEKYPKTKILILTMHKDIEYFRQAVNKGIQGYVLKDEVFDKLISAIKLILDGKQVFTEDLSSDKSEIQLPNISSGSLGVLSKREKQILELIAKGFTSKEIASQLTISRRTVESHRAHIMEKLKTKNVADLVRFAFSQGLS